MFKLDFNINQVIICIMKIIQCIQIKKCICDYLPYLLLVFNVRDLHSTKGIINRFRRSF